MENVFGLFVQLDPSLQVVVEGVVTFVVSYLTLQLTALSPTFAEYLGQYKVGIVTWLTGVAIQVSQAQLNKVPENWDEVASIAMKLAAQVVVVLFGFSAVRAKQWKGHSALK